MNVLQQRREALVVQDIQGLRRRDLLIQHVDQDLLILHLRDLAGELVQELRVLIDRDAVHEPPNHRRIVHVQRNNERRLVLLVLGCSIGAAGKEQVADLQLYLQALLFVVPFLVEVRPRPVPQVDAGKMMQSGLPVDISDAQTRVLVQQVGKEADTAFGLLLHAEHQHRAALLVLAVDVDAFEVEE